MYHILTQKSSLFYRTKVWSHSIGRFCIPQLKHGGFRTENFDKRKPFEYEHEVRAIIDIESIPRDGTYKSGKPLKIDVKTLIGKDSEVIVSPHADEWIAGTLELIVERCGFRFPVNRSELLDRPS